MSTFLNDLFEAITTYNVQVTDCNPVIEKDINEIMAYTLKRGENEEI